MKYYKAIGFVWLVLGGLAFLFTCLHTAAMAGFIHRRGGLEALACEILGCVFTLIGAVAGFGLVRHWRWARVAIEVLGSVLLTYSVIVLLFVEVNFVFGMAASWSLFSVLVTLFVPYDSSPI